ncbi:hypothetical protein CAPTEDRAFT_204990 [Capitella teleta]|uniref:C3H1-type domain-containing protein n=1 Tax=Capitella teleta TaxID=283909 RepID=R7USI1_CAPTE|nr:hypothetical protein CAPTEDRAFT_204990 [Capitella teleta]|eukprot:ELU06371.1 hypothetical protein CAPTEDRAFT_204990 [Capitella teleta]
MNDPCLQCKARLVWLGKGICRDSFVLAVAPSRLYGIAELLQWPAIHHCLQDVMPIRGCALQMLVTMDTSFSDGSDASSSPETASLLALQENGGSDICRDYLRNVCKRGKRCKYRHPMPNEAKELCKKQEYTFCHDFQNSGCRRASCRFIHCSREEEEYYKQTGQLPVRLQQAAALGIGVVPNEVPLQQGEVPICKDYLKGECKRAGRCKYRHLSSSQYDVELHTRIETPRTARTAPEAAQDVTELFNNDEYERYDYEHQVKRRRIEEITNTYLHITTSASPVGPNGLELAAPAATSFKLLPSQQDYRLLEEENGMLRRKVDELKKQVSDLAATNEVLLEQNARYRSRKVQTLVTPIVTVSQVVTPTITATHSVARPAVPPPVLQALTSMTTIPHVTVNANHAGNELVVSQLALQPRLAGDLAQQASLAQQPSIVAPITAPSAINQPPSSVGPIINPVAAGPTMVPLDTAVSLAVVSMPQSLAPGNASLPQTSMPAGAQCAILQGSTTLVSYPAMSHSQLPNSSLG